MGITILKQFFIVACAIFLYAKFINYKSYTFLKGALCFIFAVASACAFLLLENIPAFLEFAGLILLLGVFMALLTKRTIDISLTLSLLSMVLSYVLAACTFFVACILVEFVFHSTNIWLAVAFSPVNFLIIHFVFRIKRLRNGLQFIQKKETGGIGITISGILFICLAIAENRTTSDMMFGALCLGAVICAVGIFFWWRSSLTKMYISNLQKSNAEEMKRLLDQKDTEIRTIREGNDFLSSIIHRDNKMLPTMALAVTQFIEQHSADDSAQQAGHALLDTLANLMNERSALLLNRQKKNKKLPPTNIPLIDSTLQYFQLKAADNSIDFDVLITGNIRHMIETAVTISQLQTILADHIENAMIATKYCEHKKILVILGICDDDTVYELSIKDSGSQSEYGDSFV